MRTSDAVKRAIVGDPSPVTDMTELAREYGGTAGLARELGVSRRTAQRYLAPEGRQRRQPAARLRPRLADLGRAAGERRRIAEFRQQGMTVTFTGRLQFSDEVDFRGRKVTVHFGRGVMDPFLDAAQAHRWTAASAELEANFLDGYGLSNSAQFHKVDRLNFTPGDTR